MRASDALSALKVLYDVANQVKDHKDELIRVSRRIEYIVVAIEESRDHNVIRPDEYKDALSAIAHLITRTQRVSQRLLKRDLGDRTWNASEISLELRRLNDDVQNYLSVDTVWALDIKHGSNFKQHSVLANNPEEIMVQVAELDLYLRTRTGDGWAPSIKSRAESNFAQSTKQEKKSLCSLPPKDGWAPSIKSGAESNFAKSTNQEKMNYKAGVCCLLPSQVLPKGRDDIDFETLRRSGKPTVKVTGLKSNYFGDRSLAARDLQLNADASQDEIMHAIKEAGFLTPDKLYEERKLSISVTEGDSVYDASIPGGLKVNKSEPLLWWWNKYTTYHGLAPATTPGHTMAQLVHDHAKQVIGVEAACVRFSFHRTLRVPDTGINNLPASLGTFPLVPVDSFSRGVHPALRNKGGFLMPMFRREAIWLNFKCLGETSAVKISVGGVNALSGRSTNSMEPPMYDAEQDYIVVGRQPWLDGIVTGPGVVRQFVATSLGSGYTVEEQVTGKAEIGGFQFDIFRRRPSVDGKFLCHTGEELNSVYSPSELKLADGKQLILERTSESADINWPQNGWSLADYKRRVSPGATIGAYYNPRRQISYSDCAMSLASDSPAMSCEPAPGILGLSAGGRIAQKIYRDKDSPKVYDEEHGHRFYVHIVTPELWETITGVLPPITPITRDMYIRNGVNWFKIYDDYVDSITTVSEKLRNVLSVTQLDQKLASSAESQSENLIDPKAPPDCSLHPGTKPSCVFRPCNHLACQTCFGSAFFSLKCPKCQVVFETYVGIEKPLPAVHRIKGKAYQEGEWSVKETEKLAATAAGSDTVIVIHHPENRPSPLYSAGQSKFKGGSG